jgi:hypothetical protein
MPFLRSGEYSIQVVARRLREKMQLWSEAHPYVWHHKGDKVLIQGDEEWFLAHAGVLSGTNMDVIMNGGHRAWCTLLDRKKAEIEDPQIMLVDSFCSAGMQRGKDLEDVAIAHYELIHDVDVERPAWVFFDELGIGCSPDFNRSKDGIVGEVKCPANPSIHMMSVMHGTGAETYKPQIQCEILCTNSSLNHFLSYDPRVKDPKLQLKLIIVERDNDYLDKMANNCIKFYEYLKSDTRPQAPSTDVIPTLF